MKNKTSIFILFFFVLTGCLSIKPSKIPTETKFNSESEDGLVIGTITFVHPKKKSPYDSYKFHLTYDGEDTKETKAYSTYFEVNVNLFNGRFNGKLNERKTYPIVLSQKPGSYNFDGFYFFWNGGMITSEFKNPVHFNLPFTVEKSKITYIGNIIVYVKSKSNPYIEITDKLDVDINHFKTKYLNIDWSLVQNKTIKSGYDGGGFIKLNK